MRFIITTTSTSIRKVAITTFLLLFFLHLENNNVVNGFSTLNSVNSQQQSLSFLFNNEYTAAASTTTATTMTAIPTSTMMMTRTRTRTRTRTLLKMMEFTTTSTKLPKITLYNSLHKRKTPFVPLEPPFVSMYTCGPTVYDSAHVGNFRAFLTYDLLKRVLTYLGYNVKHICNLTDVDDKIIKRANEGYTTFPDKTKIKINSIRELTTIYEKLFLDDLQSLNIIPAELYPRATEHIDEMVQLVQLLEQKGLAYQSSKSGSWYFNVGKKNGYGKQLVDLDVSQMKLKNNNDDNNNNNNDNDNDDDDADEYEPNEKNGLRDFALWKAPKKDFDRPDATWDTPIGKGRPAWHLECSAMAYKYLGPQIDIHCGGVDLMFPHHENEIAQSEGAYSKNGAMNGGKRIKKKDGEEEEEDQVEDGNNLPFCGCWIHNGFVNVGDEKMSKSKGNFLTLRTACPTNIDIRAYRYLVISSQYRNPLSLTSAAMGAARGALKRLDTILGKLDTALLEKEAIVDTNNNNNNELTKIAQQSLVEFKEAIADDLGTPRAAAILFSLAKAAEGEFKRVKKAVTIWEEEEEEQRGASSDDNDIKPRLNLLGLKLIREAMGEIDQVFGIFYEVPATAAIGSESSNDNNDSGTISSNNKDAVPDKVMELVKARTKARDDNNWDLADTLRVTIMEEGFEVKDVKGGEPLVTPRSS